MNNNVDSTKLTDTVAINDTTNALINNYLNAFDRFASTALEYKSTFARYSLNNTRDAYLLKELMKDKVRKAVNDDIR